MPTFTRRQWAIFFACFIAYTAAYIARTNLSPALPAISDELGLSGAQGGMLATGFAITYAAGQLVNGFIADRVNVRVHILVGLLGSAVLNLIFSVVKSYPALLLVWTLNGAFQSMLWTPIVRVLALRFDGAAQKRAVFGVSMTLIFGYLISWSLTGALTSALDWRWAYKVSAAATIVLSIVSFVLLGSDMPKAQRTEASEGAPIEGIMPLGHLLRKTGLIFILACCVTNGYVRDGIMTWAPKMLMDTQGIDTGSVVGTMLIIPAINLVGILLSQRIYGWMDSNARRTATVMMCVNALFALILAMCFRVHPLLCALLLGATSAVAYGLNPILTTVMPMDYTDTGRVAGAAGMIDACIYLGSALAGVLTGAIHDSFGWTHVFVSWIILSCLGAAMMWRAEKIPF